jgi:hypothetical protein
MSTDFSNIGEDVIRMIFDRLDGEDLLNCEFVCRQWRDILLTETPWKRLLCREVNSFSPLSQTRQILKKLESNEYRSACRSILLSKRNWRTRNFTRLKLLGDRRWTGSLIFVDDHVAWDFAVLEGDDSDGYVERPIGYAFLEFDSEKINEIPSVYMLNGEWANDQMGQARKKMVVNINCPRNQYRLNIVCAEDESLTSSSLSFTGRQLFCLSNYEAEGRSFSRIRIWKMQEGNTLILTHDRPLDHHFLKMKYVDDKFIVACVRGEPRRFLFISSETLNVVRSVRVSDPEAFTYNGGLLFQFGMSKGIVRILDVASGNYFNHLHLHGHPMIELLEPSAKSNSTVIVICWRYMRAQGREKGVNDEEWVNSYLSVYDLEAVKTVQQQKQHEICSCVQPLYMFKFLYEVENFALDETRLAVIGNGSDAKLRVDVLNFSAKEC